MVTTKIDGDEPATGFHITRDDKANVFAESIIGLTIRQEFAARAMQCLISQINVHDYKELARYSVVAADELIKALNNHHL